MERKKLSIVQAIINLKGFVIYHFQESRIHGE